MDPTTPIIPALEAHHHDDAGALEQAKRQGYLIRSGRPVHILLAWERYCRETGRNCVVGIKKKLQGIVEVNWQQRWKGPIEELEVACSQFVNAHQGDLFEED